jgi:hypothetical protein
LSRAAEFDPSQKRDDTGQWSDGGGSSSTKKSPSSKKTHPKLEQAKPTINPHGTDLVWKGEDTIAGSLVLETPDESIDFSNVDDDAIKNYIKSHLPKAKTVAGLRDESDIEDIAISNVRKGKGYIQATIDITPTEDAANAHYEGNFEDEIATLYRSGGMKGEYP